MTLDGKIEFFTDLNLTTLTSPNASQTKKRVNIYNIYSSIPTYTENEIDYIYDTQFKTKWPYISIVILHI